jgi:hypothetical protein
LDSSTRCQWRVAFAIPTGTTVSYTVDAPAAAGPSIVIREARAHHAHLAAGPIDAANPGLTFLGYTQDVPFDDEDTSSLPKYWTVVGADWADSVGYTPLIVLPGLHTAARANIADGLWANIAHVQAPTPKAAELIASNQSTDPDVPDAPELSLFTVRANDVPA